MQRPPIDLRSDTVTRPTPAMRRAMAEAEVGDDVFGDDPTVNALEARTAELLGKEAALFVPSGTMANQIAVGVHARPGDELLCDATSHVYVWEGGGIARLSGVTARTFEGDGGLLSLDDLARRDPARRRPLRPDPAGLPGEHPQPRRRPGPPDRERRRDRAAGPAAHGLAMHLDGARLMNAVVAIGRAGRASGRSTSTRSRSASPRAWARRSARPWPARPRRSARRTGSARSSAAGCGRPASSPPRRSTPSSTTSTAWPRTTPTPRSWPRAFEETEGFSLESGPVETNLVWIAVDPVARHGRRGRRLPPVARHPGQRPRGPGAPGLHPPGRHPRRTSSTPPSVIRQIEPAMITAMTLVY